MVKLTPSLVYVRTKNSVENVIKLNLWGCEVDDIELCAEMPKLQILSLSVNKVSNLSPLQYCKELEELYIRKNRIDNIDELKHLKNLSKLKVLWIEENPCTENSAYRNKVIQMLPQLTTLDNKAIVRENQNEIEDPVQVPGPTPSISASMACQGSSGSNHSESSETDNEMTTSQIFVPLNRTRSLMNASMIGSYVLEEPKPIPGWEDFQIDEVPESMEPSPQMFQSFYEGRRPPRGYATHIFNEVQRGSLTRKRFNLRSQSMSPAKIPQIQAKTIDNKLTGSPTVKCGPDSIQITGATEEDFEGVLYIKSWRRTSGCFTAYERSRNTTKNPTFSIPLGELSRCGLELRRNAERRELEIFTVFMFSFHPSFVTMSDRAFAVHCIFQQQTVTVATKFNFISDITTRATFNGVHRMPDPILTIVNGRVPDEKLLPASRVKVGDPIMFIWNTSPPSEVFGIQVLDCLAQTLDGRKKKIIENGCTTDDIIISSVQYGDSNQKAFSDAMAFKFPDAEDVWIKCSVRTCIQKRDHILIESGVPEDHLCQKEPQCKNRTKRSSEDISNNDVIEGSEHVHVLHNKLQVFDIYAKMGSNKTSEASPLKSETQNPQELQTGDSQDPPRLCMLKSVYASSAAFLVTLYVTTILSGGVFVYSIKKQNHVDVRF
ncbi:hypothetical protein FO519_003974 [Halicephalobus sp. NKZ332]|nr:hypothetical protein FO519_003974 [Halicephalobus sp. NKZ332]